MGRAPVRVIVVVGARPNFIKIGPLVPTLISAGIETHIAHTGQHYDAAMSDVFFADLELPAPTWMLGVGSGTHAVQTGKAMIALEELFAAERPDAVIVVGDVNSTLAAALAAAKLQIPVVHLEAGLRSGDMSMPEEVNRLVTDQLSSMLLTPVPSATDNLIAEGIDASRISFVGNIMAESVLRNLERIAHRTPCRAFGLAPGEYALSTVHRPENTDHPERMAEIAAALRELPLPVLLPSHPRTRSRLEAVGLGEGRGGVHVVDPVGYLDMLALQRDAALVITDSGGIQEETCMLGTPCVTVRRNTERQITVEIGSNRLVSADAEEILSASNAALAQTEGWDVPERWDGEVSARVAAALLGGVTPLAGQA
jgi:UDP-N-acetylglucosamine 2-epimerase (non-hydrolysing)